jgi:hypothetical protein
MTDIVEGRQTADNADSIVIFLIGARINRFWLLPISLPILSKMLTMLNELSKDPESGFLGVQTLGLGVMVQYWKSAEHLARYANARDRTHRPTMKRFYQKLFRNQAVGIWHECYVVPAGQYEGLYDNMPAFGLGKIKALHEATGIRADMRARMSAAFQETERAALSSAG